MIPRVRMARKRLGGYTITAITVEQRNGRWGWVVEVGA